MERKNSKRYSELSAIKAEALRLANECKESETDDEGAMRSKLEMAAKYLRKAAESSIVERELFTGHILQQMNTLNEMEPSGACEVFVEEFCQQKFNIFGGSHDVLKPEYEVLGAAVFIGTCLLSSDKIVNSEYGDKLNLMAFAGDIFFDAEMSWKGEAIKLAERVSGINAVDAVAHGRVKVGPRTKGGESDASAEYDATAFRLFEGSHYSMEDKEKPRGTLILFRNISPEASGSNETSPPQEDTFLQGPFPEDCSRFEACVSEVTNKTDQMILRAAYTALDAQELENEQELLDSLLTVAKILFKDGGDLMSMLDHVIEHVHGVISCDRVSIFIIDEQKNELWCKADEGTGFRVPLIRNSIAGHVAYTGEPLNIPDAYKDERFDPKYDKLNKYKTDTILCLPILDEAYKTIGVIQAINKVESTHGLDIDNTYTVISKPRFSSHDQTLLTTVCEELGSVLNLSHSKQRTPWRRDAQSDKNLHSLLSLFMRRTSNGGELCDKQWNSGAIVAQAHRVGR